MSSHVALAERIANDLSETLRKAEGAIAELVQEGDSDRLADTRAQADAHRLYEERAGAIDRAQVFAQIKLLAEAGLGALSFDDYPTLAVGSYPDGVKIGPHLLPVVTVKRWRILAHAQERGVLLKIVSQLVDADVGLGTHAVAEACSRHGVSGVPGATMTKLVKRETLKRGLNIRDVTAQVGLHESALYNPALVMRWDNAKLIAEKLGVNPLGLPFAARKRKVTRSKRRWLRRERVKTGGRWDETYSRFRRCLDEFQRVAGEGVEWDPAYEHFYALEEIIGRSMKREVIEPKPLNEAA